MSDRVGLDAFAEEVRRRLDPFDDVAAEAMQAGLSAADPYEPTRDVIEDVASRGAVPVAVGKAAVPMARAWQDWGGPPGLIVGPEGIEPDLDSWEVHWGEHPVPGARSYAAGQRVVDVVRQGLPVVLLLSGGASSLLESPTVDAEDHRRLARDLVRAGLPIEELNAARSLISEVKAGGLAGEAERAGTRLTVVYVSDVPGDDPALVGSGPGIARDRDDLLAAIGEIPDGLRQRVLDAAGWETPRATATHHLALPREAPVRAAADRAEELSVDASTCCLDGPLEDGADRVAEVDDELTLLWGEPHLAVPEDAGRGGRATHLVLQVADRLDDDHLVAAFATDGHDGSDGAGGYARTPVGDVDEPLAGYDSATYLEELDDDRGGVVPAWRTDANSADLGLVRRLA